MYTKPEFKSKAALKRAIAAGEHVTVFQPLGEFTGFNPGPYNGTEGVEGPHYPKPHTWYAKVEVADGTVVKVVS